MNKIIKKFYKKLKLYHITILKNKNIRKKKYKRLIKSVVLNREQIKSIDDIWEKNFGKKISKKWHRLYTSYLGEFNKYYFPEILFENNLLYKLNPFERNEYLDDKILTSYFLKGLEDSKYKLATNYVYNCSGYYYDDNRNSRV